MKVAVLFSAGKDSTYAIDYAISKKWNIEYLLTVKPNRTDCYLFHYATTEHAEKIAKLLNIKHISTECKVADPKKEAEIVKEIVEKNPVDILILGGTGLQETQLKSLQETLKPLNIKVIASHSGKEHIKIMKQMAEKNYKFMITQIASDGLNKEWLGKIIDKTNLNELIERAEKYGFHIGGEGGYYDSLVIDAPIFTKKLQIEKSKKIMENECTGYLKIEKLNVVD